MKRSIQLIGVLILSVSPLLTGCAKKSTSAAATPASGGGGGDPQAQHVIRGREKRIIEGHFGQLALFIQQYRTEHNKAPAGSEDVQGYIKRDAPEIYRALAEGRYVVVPNAPAGSNSVVVYEKDKDLNNARVVLFGDGSVRTLPEPEFQVALKNKS